MFGYPTTIFIIRNLYWMNKTKNVPVLNELKKLGKFGYSLVSNWFHILSAIWAQSWTNFHNDMESIDLRVYKI